MVPRGLEPRTLWLLAIRSNQLSYETKYFTVALNYYVNCARPQQFAIPRHTTGCRARERAGLARRPTEHFTLHSTTDTMPISATGWAEMDHSLNYLSSEIEVNGHAV